MHADQPATTFTPGPKPNTVRSSTGAICSVPEGWVLVPPGDAALTRRIRVAGECWSVAEKRGRKVFSRGVWAPAATVERIKSELEQERATAAYAQRREADTRRRKQTQRQYADEFRLAVRAFLNFHADYAELADRLAHAVADHATPVGSGTVARTKRIPIEERAEAAVIAWLRHQTTGYDAMTIPRVKGKRREVRRLLARRSVELLQRYRKAAHCSRHCARKRARMWREIGVGVPPSGDWAA